MTTLWDRIFCEGEKIEYPMARRGFDTGGIRNNKGIQIMEQTSPIHPFISKLLILLDRRAWLLGVEENTVTFGYAELGHLRAITLSRIPRFLYARVLLLFRKTRSAMLRML